MSVTPHQLTGANRPHNSLYVISDEGRIANRYDKRICSHTEITRSHGPGFVPTTFDVDGVRFGCVMCIEINFPESFLEYERLGVDCLLVSVHPTDAMFQVETRAHTRDQQLLDRVVGSRPGSAPRER